MKRILAAAILVLSSVPVQAQHRHHGAYATGVPHHHYYPKHRHNHGAWVAPLIIGGVVGYAITRNQNDTVIVQQPPVVYQYNTPNCSYWVETLQPDGTIVRQRTCTQ